MPKTTGLVLTEKCRKRKLAEEAQRVMNGFKAEYGAVGKIWNMVRALKGSEEENSKRSYNGLPITS